MGLTFPIKKLDDRIVLDIPERNIPFVIPIEIPEKVMITANTYVYGGGDIVTVDNIKIPRTGVYGSLPIPINPKLTHFRKKGARKWTYISEEPILYTGFWRAGYWRASIPKSIRVKYKILPDMECQLVYTERVPAWLVNIIHLGKTYTARWYPRQHVVRWEITPDNLCYESIKIALENGMACSGDCHIEGSTVYVDIVFSGSGGKIISQKIGRCYRYMAVRNFNLENEISEYPVNAELRASYITTCSREYYQSGVNFMRLIEALEITVRNIQAWFLYSFHKALKPKDDEKPVIDRFDETGVMFGDRILKRGSRMKITKGVTKPQELHPSVVEGFPWYHCIKYCRISLPRWEHEYSDKEIESKLLGRLRKLEDEKKIPTGLIYFDLEGFLWMKQE